MRTRICGIPCQVEIQRYFKKDPDRYADNRDDYYGYVDMDYEIQDRNGRYAPWLERKMSEKDIAQLESEIHDHVQVERWDGYHSNYD